MYKFPLHLPFPYYLLLKMLPHLSCSFQTTFLVDRGLDNVILPHLQRQAQGPTRRGLPPVFSDVSQDLGPRLVARPQSYPLSTRGCRLSSCGAKWLIQDGLSGQLCLGIILLLQAPGWSLPTAHSHLPLGRGIPDHSVKTHLLV